MQEKPEWFYRQAGVIPCRVTARGTETLLITSRHRKHWIIPKGIVEPDLTPAASAIKEAWEEAGIHGRIDPTPVGSYSYKKWGGTCRVVVFLMMVDKLADRWPEAALRARCWLPWDLAAEKVREGGLRRLLLALPDQIAAMEKNLSMEGK